MFSLSLFGNYTKSSQCFCFSQRKAVGIKVFQSFQHPNIFALNQLDKNLYNKSLKFYNNNKKENPRQHSDPHVHFKITLKYNPLLYHRVYCV